MATVGCRQSVKQRLDRLAAGADTPPDESLAARRDRERDLAPARGPVAGKQPVLLQAVQEPHRAGLRKTKAFVEPVDATTGPVTDQHERRHLLRRQSGRRANRCITRVADHQRQCRKWIHTMHMYESII